MTAPKPLYSPNGVSRFTISAPVVRNPRFLAYEDMRKRKLLEAYIFEARIRTPGCRARLDNCMRTLMVSGVVPSQYSFVVLEIGSDTSASIGGPLEVWKRPVALQEDSCRDTYLEDGI